jgi:effector-binding domain-containing protein
VAVTVELIEVEAFPTAVVRRLTSWREFPALWRVLLDEVYAFLRDAPVRQSGHNVMLYLNDRPLVEVGVQVEGPFEGRGEVICSQLPSGQVAWARHRGSYHELGATHDAINAYCRERGISLRGPRWEVYGDWHEDPAKLETDVYYLLA